MASGDRTIAFTEEQLEDLSETFETVLEREKMNQSYLDRIPNEILEKILLDVPTFALPLKKPWVCKTLTSVIMTPRYWVNKLKKYGLIINEKIWTLLEEFNDNEIVPCLYYASMYQEYCTKNALVPDFFLEVPKPGITENWFIFDDCDNAMEMASGVLICREMGNCQCILNLDERENITGLPLLLRLFEARKVRNLSLKDNYGFWNLNPRMNYLQIMKEIGGENNILEHFTGCLTTLEGFPADTYELRLAIAVDEQNVAIDPGFSNLSNTSDMWLHLKAGADISNLPKFSSDHENIRLVVSEMEKSYILWMDEVAKKLPKVHVIAFFKYQLDFDSTKYLLQVLAKSGMEIAHEICLSSSTMDRKCRTLLKELINKLWTCRDEWLWFYLLKSDSDLLDHVQREHAELVFYCKGTYPGEREHPYF